MLYLICGNYFLCSHRQNWLQEASVHIPERRRTLEIRNLNSECQRAFSWKGGGLRAPLFPKGAFSLPLDLDDNKLLCFILSWMQEELQHELIL